MSLQYSAEIYISRKILQAVARAIKNLEAVITGTIGEYDIDRDTAELLCSAVSDLWAILETNGYTIDTDTNRLRRVKL